jgi:hypothetical protein
MMPGAKKIELFACNHNIRPGWFSIGNQYVILKLNSALWMIFSKSNFVLDWVNTMIGIMIGLLVIIVHN